MKKFKITKAQATIGILAVAAAGALTAASAASLSVQATSTLQAGTTDVAGCQVSVLNVEAGTPAWSNGAFEVSTIDVSNFDADCVGKNVKLEVLDAAGVSLASGSSVAISGNAVEFNLPAAVDAEEVDGYAVVIF